MSVTDPEKLIRSTLESMVLPTVFCIMSAASLIAFIFIWYKELYLFLLPSGFLVFSFGAVSFVTWIVRKRIREFINERERVRQNGRN